MYTDFNDPGMKIETGRIYVIYQTKRVCKHSFILGTTWFEWIRYDKFPTTSFVMASTLFANFLRNYATSIILIDLLLYKHLNLIWNTWCILYV